MIYNTHAPMFTTYQPLKRFPLTCFLVAALGVVVFQSQCQRRTTSEDGEVWKKIRMDLSRYDADGWSGSGVTGNYEFCIPQDPDKWKAVQKIDTTAQKSGGSGRVGCTTAQWLVIGSTRQPHFRRTLYRLASLPFVERIEETFWE
jgi:hypothetical protein